MAAPSRFLLIQVSQWINICVNKDFSILRVFTSFLILKMFWVTFEFEHTYIKIWVRGLLFLCNTGTIRKPKLLLSLFTKTKKLVNQVHSEKIMLEDPIRAFCNTYLSLLGIRNLTKILVVFDRMFCYPPSINICNLVRVDAVMNLTMFVT